MQSPVVLAFLPNLELLMSSSVNVVPTIGAIANRLGEPVHRIEYIIKTRSIQPVGRAGNCRVFSEDDVAFIAAEIRRIDSEKGEVL